LLSYIRKGISDFFLTTKLHRGISVTFVFLPPCFFVVPVLFNKAQNVAVSDTRNDDSTN